MKTITYFLAILVIVSATEIIFADQNDNLISSNIRPVNGDGLKVEAKRLTRFVEKFPHSKIAIVSVQGMVCDFCARGLEKTFKKNQNIEGVDIDLTKGKVLLAFNRSSRIDFDDIKNQTLANGINAVALKLL